MHASSHLHGLCDDISCRCSNRSCIMCLLNSDKPMLILRPRSRGCLVAPVLTVQTALQLPAASSCAYRLDRRDAAPFLNMRVATQKVECYTDLRPHPEAGLLEPLCRPYSRRRPCARRKGDFLQNPNASHRQHIIPNHGPLAVGQLHQPASPGKASCSCPEPVAHRRWHHRAQVRQGHQ